MALGGWVRCERDTRSRGTWPRYAGRVGMVVSINRPACEIGVRFTADTAEGITWFLPDELANVPRPRKAPDIRLQAKLDPSIFASAGLEP